MKKRVKLRALLIGGLWTLFFVTMLGRIYYVQAVEGDILLRQAKDTWETSKSLIPTRGTIYDRDGGILAQDGPAYTVAVNPKLIHEYGIEKEIVDGLGPLLGMTAPAQRDKLYEKVTEKQADGSYFMQREIRNEGFKIDADLAAEIEKLIDERELVGVYLLPEQKRYYPTGELASHVLGYMNREGEPVMGLELQYTEQLSGTPGRVSYEKDLLGYMIPDSQVALQPAVNGKSLKLTIDETIQAYMEQAMQTVYDTYQPKAMMAIAADPKTMEILAMANMPTFDPNAFWEFDTWDDFKNNAISNIYEPGSTFKIMTLAGAVEEGLFNPEDTYDSGRIKVADSWINDHNNGQGWGTITYLDGLKRSSNVAFVKLGYEMLGAQKLREYIDRFGFGMKTGIDLPGESAGGISFRNDIPTEVATATFGQGRVEVTALQQLTAVSAIANGGKLMQPYIVKEVIDSETGEVLEQRKPKVVRQAVSEETAREVGLYLEQVVSDLDIGTGRRAYIEGFRIAGKTGTAQKVVNGKYSTDNQYVLSFVGYAPVDDPQISLIVIVDEPKLTDYRQGGDVVGPLFKEIIGKSLHHLGVAADLPQAGIQLEQFGETVPDLTGYATLAAQNELMREAYSYEVLGSGDKVVAQFPEPGTQRAPAQRIYLMTEQPNRIEMPNLTGKSMRDALQIASLLNVKLDIEGEGYVADQAWVGTNPEDRTLKLTLRPLGTPPPEGESNPSGEDAERDDDEPGEEADDMTTDEQQDESENSAGAGLAG